MYMENKDELIRQIIREEIQKLLEDSTSTAQELVKAKAVVANKTEEMEDASGLDKLKSEKDVINAKKNVLSKVKSHVAATAQDIRDDERVLKAKLQFAQQNRNTDTNAGMGFSG